MGYGDGLDGLIRWAIQASGPEGAVVKTSAPPVWLRLERKWEIWSRFAIGAQYSCRGDAGDKNRGVADAICNVRDEVVEGWFSGEGGWRRLDLKSSTGVVNKAKQEGGVR
jgi:hypothetical protein